jgi:hypothetical protein
MVRKVLSAAFALTLAGLSLATARAETVDIYDGLTFDQFKAILSQTNLTLEERVTDKGNRYFFITVEGSSVPFVGGMSDCGERKVCDGFTFLFIDVKHRMTTDAMAQFNKDQSFLKATPAIVDPTDVVISGEFFARGGITAMHVVFSAAYYAAALESFLKQADGAIAMNGRDARWTTASAGREQADRLFAEFTRKGGRKARPLGAFRPAIDEAVIDAAAAPRR